MRTILLITYDMSPYKGSEASVSRNYVSKMAEHNKLITIYGKGKEDVERYLKQNQMPNVRFINIPFIPVSGSGLIMDIEYNLNYRKWHWQAYLWAEDIVEREHVDVIHYLNPIGFKEPGYCWKIKNSKIINR